MSRSRFGVGAAALAAAAALALSACGSDDDSSTTASGGTGTAAASTTGASTTGSSTTAGSDTGIGPVSQDVAVKTATEYTGATAGAADTAQESIKIGWANADEGKAPQPGMTRAVKAAFEFVNKELGGVKGRPLELVEDPQCKLGGAEKQGALCAQALVNKKVNAVLFGYAPVGGRSFLASMAESPDVPVIGAVPLSPTDFTAKSSYFTSGGPFAVGAAATFMKDQGYKSSAQIWPDDPANAPFIQSFEGTVKSQGIKVTSASIPPDSTDVLAAVTAAQPASQDSIGVNAFVPGQCTAITKALETLGAQDKPTLTVGSICLDASVKDALGDFPKYIFAASYPNQAIADPTNQNGTFQYALNTYDAADAKKDIDGFYVPQYFGLALTLQKWLAEVEGDTIDNSTLGPVIKKFEGQIWGGADNLKFGQPGTPSVASFASRFAKYEGDGKWSYVSEWVSPPPPAE